ncbi:hypothetical protein B0T14DRAFT_414897, partial [Immersiella caudata]
KIEILSQPSEFLEALLSGITSAKRKIFLCSLYVGTDVPVLVSALSAALRDRSKLTVYILLDRLRCTRTGPDSDGTQTTAHMLLPLLQEFGPGRVTLRFYHTPNLRGLWERLVPRRLKEGFGLQHIKFCGFDDQAIVTGANLSGEYFSNRQDRYYSFSESPELVDYMETLVTTLGRFSYSISHASDAQQPTFEWPKANHTPLPLEQSDEETIRESARRHLIPLIWNSKTGISKKQTTIPSATSTVVYPLAQLNPLLGRSSGFPTSTHEWALTHLLSVISTHCATWTFSTPYLSLTPGLQRWMIDHRTASSSGTVIAAAPEAMSFYGAKGLARYIPRAFSEEFRKLQRLFHSNNPSILPRLLQWRRGTAHAKNGWTFHAKGWWIGGLPGWSEEDDLSMTIVGSSNYGERSLNLDLELDLLIVTRDAELKKRIHSEEQRMLKHGRGDADVAHGKRANRVGGILEGVIVWVLMAVIGLMGLSI